MRIEFLALAFLMLGVPAVLFGHDEECPQCGAKAGPVGKPGLLIVGNKEGQTIALTPEQFAAIPQTNVEVAAPDGSTVVYQGVPLGVLLQRAGVRFDEIHEKPETGPPLLATCVLVDATDGYRTAFSIPEVAPDKNEPPVLVAHSKNGEPLGSVGPYQIVEPRSTMRGRWVRQVARILVRPIEGTAVHHDPDHTGETTEHAQLHGKLFLVGLGPGDPELVTVRAVEILRAADRVYCYYWLKDEVLAVARPEAVQVASPSLIGGQFVGRDPADVEPSLRERVAQANQAFSQFRGEVEELLQQGKTVAVVAAGDPTMYSPWGWIPEQLADLEPIVVPGISSFNAANAALKHGAVGASYYMLSAGHDLPAVDQSGRLSGVVVLFTHTSKLADQVAQLRDQYPVDTPLAIVCDASYPTEQVFRGTLGTILSEVDAEKLPHLYLIYVGDGLTRKHNSR